MARVLDRSNNYELYNPCGHASSHFGANGKKGFAVLKSSSPPLVIDGDTASAGGMSNQLPKNVKLFAAGGAHPTKPKAKDRVGGGSITDA